MRRSAYGLLLASFTFLALPGTTSGAPIPTGPTLQDLIDQVSLFIETNTGAAPAVTVIGTGPNETGTATIDPFTLRFGTGALVLLEGTDQPPANRLDTSTTSDILVFAPMSQKVITLFSDPLPAMFTLADGSKLTLDQVLTPSGRGGVLKYMKEGTIVDETGTIPLQNSPVPDVSVYVRSGSTFTRAFFVLSDTTETEVVPEPGSLVLLSLGFAGLAGFARIARRRRSQ